jgi:glycosyltransferase involved in cell wall biosynthesis
MYSEEFIEPLTKENTVIFPHRLDAEKQPELFTKLAAQLPEKFSAIKTAEVCANDKAKYYRILNKGKVAISFAKQETWGIAMQEALFCGCIPILPARLSYKELFPPVCLYKSDSDVLKKTLFFLEEYDEMYARLASFRKGLAYKTEHAIENIITQIKCI